ncbi:hypothetical protein [Neobacillus vireti]|uniref:hypothetical protein n=1 Tax=Neobacillus vireti TaxID=220686 RepID=UPI000B32CB48|nr:hypothetical protein [Neobacillus vireti]
MMYKKTCPKCHQPSFSSSISDKWTCPTCSNDLTHERPHDAESSKRIKPQLYLIKNCDAQFNPKSDPQMSPYLFKSFD